MKVWDSLPKPVKISVSLVAAVAMFVATIIGAMAASVDGEDRFVVARGERVEASFLIIDPAASGSVSTISSLIILDGRRTLSYSELERFEDSLVVPYVIDIPDGFSVGRYKELIRVVESGKEVEMNVIIDVQRDWVVSLSRIGVVGNTRINVSLLIFVVAVLFIIIISILLNYRLRGGSSGRK